MKKYKILLADPPWNYRDKASAGKRGAEFKYPCMKLEDIKAMPVGDIVAKDAFLFMWITMPFLNKAEEVMNAWGFKYVTNGFTWIKMNKRPIDISSLEERREAILKEGDYRTPFMGMGHYSRANAELCLIGKRGRPKVKSRKVRSVVFEPVQEHSKKPDVVRDRIVELCGDLPRIELFARQKVKKWISWGNEV